MIKITQKLTRNDKNEVYKLNYDFNRVIAKLDPAFDVKLDQKVKKALDKELDGFLRKKDQFFIIAKNGDEVVGFVAYRVEKMEIFCKYKQRIALVLLFVKKEWRKKKISKRLLGEVRKQAKKKNIKWIDISTSVMNKRALKVYKKFGFKTRYTTLSIIK